MTATLPVIEVKMRIGKNASTFVILGKRNALLGVPAFLDRSLKPYRDALAAATASPARLEEAMKARAIRDAVTLAASGQRAALDLRRLYPYGLSGQIAKDIMADAAAALAGLTQGARIMGGALGLLLSAVGTFAFFLTPLRLTPATLLPPGAFLGLEIATPFLCAALAWLLIDAAERWKLGVKLPAAKLPFLQKIGPLGYGLAAAAGALSAALLLVAPKAALFLKWLA
jgi:hypothetical protein